MSADEYREAMCNELNAAGFREHFHDQESEYEADEFVLVVQLNLTKKLSTT